MLNRTFNNKLKWPNDIHSAKNLLDIFPGNIISNKTLGSVRRKYRCPWHTKWGINGKVWYFDTWLLGPGS